LDVCLIGKYPPINGGVSAVTYWRARRLGELGHNVHIVSNSWCVEPEHRQEAPEKGIKDFIPKNVHLYSTDPAHDPGYRHIPYFRPDTEMLASLAIDVVRKNDLALIDSYYLLPYCVSAYLAKKATGKPLIVRHAGSDITWLFESPFLKSLFLEVLRSADRIGTNGAGKEKLLSLGIPEARLFPNYTSIDTSAFNPNVKPFDLSSYFGKGTPIFTCVGKIHPYKGAFELVKAASSLDEDFGLLFVAGGTHLEPLKRLVRSEGLEQKCLFLPLQPPWVMPSIYAASSCFVAAEHDWPMPAHTPYAVFEAMASGRCCIIGSEVFSKPPFNSLKDKREFLVADPKDVPAFASALKWVIDNPEAASEVGRNARTFSEHRERFEEEVSSLIELYGELLG
jgi:glycosyltransferase involved in cell wall biosynthesis